MADVFKVRPVLRKEYMECQTLIFLPPFNTDKTLNTEVDMKVRKVRGHRPGRTFNQRILPPMAEDG